MFRNNVHTAKCFYCFLGSQLIHAFITSRIDYCNSLLYGMPDTILSDLQRIQNTVARILTKCGDRNYPSINLLKKNTLVTS